MFGNDSLPSRIYSYDVVDKKVVRISSYDASLLLKQLSLCNNYYNDLVSVRRKELEAISVLRNELYPGYAARNDEIEALNLKIEELFEQIRKQNMQAKKKNSGTKDQKNAIKALKAEKTKLVHQQREQKASMSNDATYVERLSVLNDVYGASRKALRKEYSRNKGLAWGSYLGIEQSQDKRVWPSYRSYDGCGRLCWQFQGGVTWSEACAGKDTRLKVSVKEVAVPIFVGGKLAGTKSKSFTIVHLKYKDTFIQLPFFMDRPLPSGVIKWCYLIRRKVGTKFTWQIQFVVSNGLGFAKQDLARDGDVAVDYGWRKTEKGLRCAYWAGYKDGRFEHGELVIPAGLVDYYIKARDIRSIRDKNFDSMKAQLMAWVDEQGPLPTWLSQRLSGLDKWKSSSRLRNFAWWWSIAGKVEGDSVILKALLDWASQDVHLHNWESSQRKKFIVRRDNFYRNFAAKLRRFFATLYVENSDLAKMKVTPTPDKEHNSAVSVYRDIVSPGRLMQILKENMHHKKVEARNSSKECHVCHKVTELADQVEYTCEHCGKKWDRDLNGAANLLLRGMSCDRKGGENEDAYVLEHKRHASNELCQKIA